MNIDPPGVGGQPPANVWPGSCPGVSRLFRGGNNASRRVGPDVVLAGRTGARRAGPTLGDMVRDAQPPSQERRRGASLGLPGSGPGSLAPFGRRVLAFLVDAFLSALVAALFTAPHL